MKYGDNHVISGPAVVLWDGITRPEEKDDGKGGKYKQFSLKVATHSGSLEVHELTAIATVALQNDAKFRGQLPAGGNWPILTVAPTDFEGRLPSHIAFNAKSGRCPQVFDKDMKEIPPMVYQNMLYPGCTVRVLVHAFSFDNKSKGIAYGLDGIQILDPTTPRLPVGGVDAVAAFGGGGQPPPAAPPAYAPPPAAPPAYAPPPAAPPAYAPPPAAPPAYAPPPAAPPVAPAPDFLTPPAAPPVAPAPPAARMVTAPNGQQMDYNGMIAMGWTDATLTANGYRL